MSDPAAVATDAPLAGPGTSLGQARGTDGRGLAGEQAPAPRVERLEFYPEDLGPWVRVLVKGGDYHAVSWINVPNAETLPAGAYLVRITPSRWDLVWNGEARATPVSAYVFITFKNLPQPLVRSIEATAGVVPAQVVRQQRTVQGPPSAGPSAAATAANLAFPLQPDPNALARSQELRDFVWQLLEHFLGAPAIRGRRVTIEDINGFAAPRPAVSAVLGRVTQAWAEMQRTHDPTLPRFKPMAELIVEQYVFGNETIVLNTLAIQDAPFGLGLYHRANGLKYYDDHGLPALDIMQTNRRDVYYASQPRPVFRYAPATRDWATLKLLQVMGGIDPEIIAVVEGYWANIDLLVKHRQAIETDKVIRSMSQQAAAILLFLAAEGVVVLLERLGTLREKLVARILHACLVVTGRFLQIRFFYGIKEVIFGIGHHLYRIRRRPDGTLDDLSQDHLNQASNLAKPLLEEIFGLLLAGAALRVASATAPLLDPPGGPGSLMFVPAPAGAGKVPFEAAPAGTAGPGAPPPDIIVVMGTGGRPSSTEKPEGKDEKPRTPRELEKELFDKDQRPDTPFYLSRINTTLRKTLEALLAHVNNPKNQQYYKPDGKPPVSVVPEKVNMKTVTFLEQPQYKDLLARYQKLLTEAHNDLMRLQRRNQIDKKTEKELTNRVDTILSFGKGIVGNKRPDKVEFFIDRREFATTDGSFMWWEEFHNLKHEVYVAAVKAATGMEGAGLEIETLQKSRLIEQEPATDEPAPPADEPEPSEDE